MLARCVSYGTIFILAVLLFTDAKASEKDSAQTTDTVLFIPDSTQGAARVDNPANFEQHLFQPPTQGLFKSFIIPGWGQIGNKRYFKAGLFFGLQTFMVASSLHFDRKAKDYFDQYSNADLIADRNVYYGLYDDQRNRRNQYRWFAAITALVAGFDAYVDAHLSGSPASRREKSLSIDTGIVGTGMGAKVSLSF